MRRDDIVPFAVKAIGMKIDALHLIGGHPAAGGVGAAIQSAGHGQPLRRTVAIRAGKHAEIGIGSSALASCSAASKRLQLIALLAGLGCSQTAQGGLHFAVR